MATRRFVVLLHLLLLPLLVSLEKFPSPNKVEDAGFWMRLGMNEIDEALQRPFYTGRAKNVIIFLGDGMGITAMTAGRIYKGQKQGRSGEEGYLTWERFPNVGLMKTYTVDKQVPDSAGTATAYLTGVKSNFKTVGVTANVKRNDCSPSLQPANRPSSVLHWAQLAGKATGFVTTTRVTHATPAALYAHSANRDWECDSPMRSAGEQANACKDIARQLVEDEPGRSIKVILAGGQQQMGASISGEDEDSCKRSDGRNLVEDWKKSKEAQNKKYEYVTSTGQLKGVNVEDTDYLLGLFGAGHSPYEVDRDDSMDGTPHIKDMTTKAIQMLQKEENGFFLLVEGGRIDHGLHDNRARRALEELVAFDEAVAAALELIDLEETLLLVTADHSHVMTMNGYPDRGNDIFGLVLYDKSVDHLPWTTLMFTNGPGFNYTVEDGQVTRHNLTGVNTFHPDYRMLSAVATTKDDETHGGEDVAAFAAGPMSHLFHRTHEQNYVAHVMGYAACIGPYDDCGRPLKSDKNSYVHIKDPQITNYVGSDEESDDDNDVHVDIVNDGTSVWHSGGTGRPHRYREYNGAASQAASLTSLFLGLVLALPAVQNRF